MSFGKSNLELGFEDSQEAMKGLTIFFPVHENLFEGDNFSCDSVRGLVCDIKLTSS